MIDSPTTIALILLATASAFAAVLAMVGIRSIDIRTRIRPIERTMLATCAAGGTAILLYRVLLVHEGWHLVEGHIDGLVIVATLLAMALLEMHRRSRLQGLAAFAMPIHTLIVLWAICASAWTYRPFRIDSIILAIHRGGIYLGAFCAIAAASGGMLFLFARRRLRAKQRPADQAPLASLEAIEQFVRRLSTVGFALLTTGVLLGIFIASTSSSQLGPVWWQTPKVILATAAWLVYAAIANGHFIARFRLHTAWLSIAGLVLILLTFAVAIVGTSRSPKTPQPSPNQNRTERASLSLDQRPSHPSDTIGRRSP